MLPKILIFVLATVTVINATVIVNVLDDDPEIGLLSAKSDCNPTECDQRCRRLKFPGGACVNGRCKCDNFRYIEELSDNSIPTAEDFSPLQDDLASELVSKKSDCNPTECDQRCRRLKFPGGACVNGRCKCDNFRYIEEFSDNSIPTAEDFSPLQDDLASELAGKKSDCNPSECDQRCRRLKFPGGACVNGRCKCDNFRNAGEELSDNSIPTAEDVSDCSPLGCDQQCRRIGFPGGVCVNGRCKCDILRNTQDNYELNLASDYSDCSPLGCEQQCRRIGFPGGVCVNGRCKCDILRNVQDHYEVDPAIKYNDCSPLGCDQQCRRIGFPGGVCVNGRCKCDILRDKRDLTLSPKNYYCNLFMCHQNCRHFNHLGGKCVDYTHCVCF
uniref:Knottins-like domain-containing protein n=1 Tax=Heliothis virescens TaxID=7102 RepID=A0A2A4JS49_HELVI